MKLVATAVDGAYLLPPDPIVDERGAFTRAFSARDLEARGLDPRVVQASLSSNTRAGTLRGMHYSAAPSREAKTVRCVRGRVHDVLVDLRPGSRSYCAWVGVELSAANALAVYVPPGVAHGFLTLEDESDLLYLMSEPYDPDAARGVRWDDPTFGIAWPRVPEVMAPRDAAYALFAP